MFARTSLFRLLALSLLGVSVVSASPKTALAEVFPANDAVGEGANTAEAVGIDEAAPEASAETIEAAQTIETANYTDGKVSLDYPATWQVEVGETGDVEIANIPETPMELVETNLYRVDAPPGPLVNANIDSFIDEGAAVGRYRSVTIDAQSALVIWLAERPGELSSAIATFIGYGDETIFLFSRYSPDNVDAEQAILSLHGSFVNLADGADTAAESTLSEETVLPVDEKPILPTEELPLQNEDFPPGDFPSGEAPSVSP